MSDLRYEEFAALEDAERAIDRYCQSLIIPAAAIVEIHEHMLWRGVARSWDDYLRDRFRLTPRHAAHVQIRAWLDAPSAIARTTIPQKCFPQELDDVSESVALEQSRQGTRTWVAIQRALAHLREARTIAVREVDPAIGRLPDGWLERLKELAEELRRSINDADHDPEPDDPEHHLHDPGDGRTRRVRRG